MDIYIKLYYFNDDFLFKPFLFKMYFINNQNLLIVSHHCFVSNVPNVCILLLLFQIADFIDEKNAAELQDLCTSNEDKEVFIKVKF